MLLDFGILIELVNEHVGPARQQGQSTVRKRILGYIEGRLLGSTWVGRESEAFEGFDNVIPFKIRGLMELVEDVCVALFHLIDGVCLRVDL